MLRPFEVQFEAQEAPVEALLGPSWGSKLGSRRLKQRTFRVGETIFFAFGGRLKEEASRQLLLCKRVLKSKTVRFDEAK